MSPWGALLLLALGQGAAAERTPAAAVGPQAQELVVELGVGRLLRQTVLALEEDGLILLPAAVFFELIEMEAAVDSAGRLTGVRYPEELSFEVDPRTRTARVGDRARALEAAEAAVLEGALYVATPVLEWLLDLDFYIDWVELRVSVANPEHLPVARRIARAEARRAREAAERAAVDHRYGLRRPRWDGAVFDWSLFVPGGRPIEEASYGLGLGLNVLGGSLEVEHEGTGEGSAGPSRTRGSWLGVWPNQAWLRQVGLGDVVGTGPWASAIRGAFATNSPFVRPAAFGEDALRGRLAPGWEVELYREGRLLDYAPTDADGSFRLATPVQYGSNPLELRAYGPSGQVEVWHRAIRVQPDRLPAGLFEYGLTAGRCRARACETQENLDLHYGLSREWTVRGGVEAFQRDTLPDLVQPYAALSGTMGNRWGLQTEALAKGFAGVDLFYEPSPDLRLAVGSAWFDRGVEFPVLTPVGARSQLRGFAFWRPIPERRSFFFDASGRHVESETFSVTSIRVGGSVQGGPVRWVGGVRYERTESGGAAFERTLGELGGSAGVRSARVRVLDRLFVRGLVAASRRGVEHADALATRPVGSRVRVEGRVSWRRGVGEPTVSLGLITTLSAVRSFSQFTRTPGGELSASNLTEGSLLWNGTARRVEAVPGRSLRRGGVGGVVFLDENGNRRYDPGEEPVPNVFLRVGPHTVRTDARGRFAVWDLVPFVTERLVVDSLTLASPLWVPAYGLATIVVAPNGYAEAHVPIVAGAEVTGRVVRRRAGIVEAVGGVRLELVHLESGRRTQVTTFYDGEFYVLGLAPGEYEVRVSPDVLAALRAEAPETPVRFSVAAGEPADAAPFVMVELVPAGR